MYTPEQAAELAYKFGRVYAHRGRNLFFTSEELAAMLNAAQATPQSEPVAWRITDGEGGFIYPGERPDELDVSWSARYGRQYEPLLRIIDASKKSPFLINAGMVRPPSTRPPPDHTALMAGDAAPPAQPKPQSEPVAWMDDFGNAFPLAANKGAGSWLDEHKRNWKPLYATPPDHTALLREALAALVPLNAAKLADGTYADKDCRITFAVTNITKALEQKP